MTQPSSPAAVSDLVITRVFDAPRDLVFQVWTDPKHVTAWWGPEHFTAPAATIDLRVGGKYLFCMRGPDGAEYWSTGIYQEIVRPERLVYLDSFADPDGNVVPGSYYGMGDDFPLEMHITVTFDALTAGKTRLTLRQLGHPGGVMREMAEAGLNTSLDKVAARLAALQGDPHMSTTEKKPSTLTVTSDREVVMTRVFDAPRELVFKAYTDPQAIPHWWGPRATTTVVEKMDVRPGGQWRFVQKAGKEEYAFYGEYREVVAPERLVQTFEFEGMPGHVVVDHLQFEDHNGKTLVTATSTFASLEDRDGMLASGMEGGALETWDRLAEYLAQPAA
jgi:uncharacterized protein YndB with AHSA1/START domain